MHCQMIIAIHKAYKITMLCQTVGLLLTPDFPKLKEAERTFSLRVDLGGFVV